jgi:hypothetical protein
LQSSRLDLDQASDFPDSTDIPPLSLSHTHSPVRSSVPRIVSDRGLESLPLYNFSSRALRVTDVQTWSFFIDRQLRPEVDAVSLLSYNSDVGPAAKAFVDALLLRLSTGDVGDEELGLGADHLGVIEINVETMIYGMWVVSL